MGAVNESLGVQKLTNSVVGSKTSGFGTSTDTTLRDELAGAAALSIDVRLTLDVHVGIFDPGHDLFIGAHVGAKAINLSANEVLLDKLHGVLACHTLELALGVFPRVDLYSAFCTAEGDVSNGELESHERCQGFYLLKINVRGVTGTTLDRKFVGRVLGSN